MAEYKTSAEAQQALAKELQDKASQLRPIYDSTDPVIKAKADALKDDINRIQNKLMMTHGIGAFGGGLASGVQSIITGLPDLGISVYNMFASPKDKVKLLSDRFAPGIESVAKDQAGLFGLGKGLGGSVGMGKGLTALNAATNVTDEMVFNGVPVTQLISAVGLLGKAGVSGVKNWNEKRGIAQIEKQLGPDGANTLREFMLKGQDSSDPRVAGIVANLRQDPKYAEIFNVLEKKATDAATTGSRVTVNPKYPVEESGKAVYQAVDNHLAGLKDEIKNAGGGAYKKAFEMAGDTPMVSLDNTKGKIADLIKQYSGSSLSDSENTLKFLQSIQDKLTAGNGLESGVTNTVNIKKMTIPELQSWLTDFGKKAAGNESLITDVSVSSQKKIASAIFGGLKEDLRTLAKTGSQDEKAVANLMIGASEKTRNAVVNYQDAIAQGLPAILKDKNLASIDTETLMKTISGLSGEQQKTLFGILQNTAPEDLKRIQQVNYDNFVQSARTVLPDGTTGVDLKLLATKFNTLKPEEQQKLALSLGTSLEDFSGKMKDAQDFFKYQQKFGKADNGASLTAADLAEMSSAGYIAGGYGTGKAIGLGGRIWNSIKGGLSDENMLNYLMSPETKDLFKDVQLSPNSVKTVEKLNRILGSREAGKEALNATRMGGQAAESAQPVKEAPTEAWDIGAPTGNDQSIEFKNDAPAQSSDPWDVGPAAIYNKSDLEKQIRDEAAKQGLGKHADLLVKQAYAESGLNPYAVSSKGASGLFQHMPATATDLGIADTFDPSQSIQGGVKYMGQLLNKYNGDPKMALAAYNWGMGNVDKNGLNNLPSETQSYLAKILG